MSLVIDRTGSRFTLENEPVVINESEDTITSLKKEYLVRLIQNSLNNKKVIAEEVFEQPPTENQIIWCLLKHKNADFAVKAERYRLEDRELPYW